MHSSTMFYLGVYFHTFQGRDHFAADDDNAPLQRHGLDEVFSNAFTVKSVSLRRRNSVLSFNPDIIQILEDEVHRLVFCC